MNSTARSRFASAGGVMLGLLTAPASSVQPSGSIVAWGSNSNGQLNMPAPNTGFVILYTGDYHSLGVNVCNCDRFADCPPRFLRAAIE